MTTKLPNVHTYSVYTKWQVCFPNFHKMYQHFPFQGPQKYTRIGISGTKINHLATLLNTALGLAHAVPLILIKFALLAFDSNGRHCQG
jgi:hypothetical protein